MPGEGSRGGSGSGLLSTRSSVIAGVVPSRRPDTDVRYKPPPPPPRFQTPLERPNEALLRQVVAGDRGLDVARRNHRRPRFGACFEPQWSPSRDEVAEVARHLVHL